MLKNVRKGRFKIALVWPKGYELLYLIPLPLAYLKANIDENLYEVQLFDNAIDNIKCRTDEFINPIKDFKPDLVGVSTWSPMFPEALDILRLSKELFPNVVTIMGGAHVTAYYKKIVGTEGIDFLMRGEGELSFPIFLDELQKESPDWSRAPGLVYPTGEDYHASEQQFAQG